MATDVCTLGFVGFIFVMCVLVVLMIAFSMMRNIMKFLMTLLANSIVGLVAMFLLSLIGIKVPMTLPVIVSVALFGLGALGTILVLMYSGMLKP